jgi:hypothetical protein
LPAKNPPPDHAAHDAPDTSSGHDLVIGPAGVTCIDTKAWCSKRSTVTLEEATLRCDGYAQTRALGAVVWEVQQAAYALGCEVHPVVGIHGAKISVSGSRLETGGVTVIEAKRLLGLLQDQHPQPEWTTARMTVIQQRAEQQFASARSRENPKRRRTR